MASVIDERQTILRAYRHMLQSVKGKLKGNDAEMIRKAFELALESHKEQRRKSGEPYILHPIEVARIAVEEMGLGPTAVACALLHDVVEDTPVTIVNIREEFGERIAQIVDGLTKLDKVEEGESQQAENFKKVLQTLLIDVRVVLIKMCDRLHNMRTLGSMPQHKKLKIAGETKFIYIPLAHRLGLYKVKSELEDIWLKINHEDDYNEISQKIIDNREDQELYIKNFSSPILEALEKTGNKFRITGRSKSIYSIWNKIKSKHILFEEIYDIFAIRIILDTSIEQEKMQCWQAYSIVTDHYKPIPERLKDFISNPKSNGYESLHTTVVGPDGKYVEVQIRTERMDDIAERGFAAHWKYKGIKKNDNAYDSWIEAIRETIEGSDPDAIEFLSDFKSNLFKDEVYVFTPAGDMVVLAEGATALDFAFQIHSEVGYHCTGVKVENRLVPLSYKLSNGDQVSVLTHKHQKPHEDWLSFVVTGKAKSKIRQALKEEQKTQAEPGKEALQRRLQNMKLDFDSNVSFLVKYYGYHTTLDLYSAIAMEQVKLADLKSIPTEGNKFVEEKKVKIVDPDLPKPAPRTKVLGKPLVLINGETAEKYDYTLATCCNPVPGDDIFAYVSTGSGMKIHRYNCSNAEHMLAHYGDRILNAHWAISSSSTFETELVIVGIDTGVGVIERISSRISTSLNLNMKSFSIQSKGGGYFEGNIILVISNTDAIDRTIKELSSIEGIDSVTRTR